MDKEKSDKKGLDKDRAKLIRNDNELGDDDEDDEPWQRKLIHQRLVYWLLVEIRILVSADDATAGMLILLVGTVRALAKHSTCHCMYYANPLPCLLLVWHAVH